MQKSTAPRESLRGGVITVLLCAAIFTASSVRADDLADAQQLFRAGQRDQALDKVNHVLASTPKEPQARFLKGVILTEQGKQAEAVEIFTKLTQDYPNLPEPYNNLAVIYANQGQYDKARTALEQSIRTHPSYATAYENLGDVYAKLASQAYGKALQLDASNKGAENKLSMVKELTRDQPPAAKPPVVVAQKTPETAKPAEKPAPKEKPAPAAAVPATDGTAEVMKAVNGWAQAWSNKDSDAYLAYYAKDFKTPGGEARPQWEKGRRERIAAPKSIHVGIDQPKVTMKGPQEASVSFRQSYRSDKLKTTSRKTLELVKADGRWVIREEKAGK